MSNTVVEAVTSPETLLKQLRWRYAVKKFDSAKKISDVLWNTLEESLVLAPSSFGLQPWKFFVVKNSALRSELRPASWNQTQITEASHLVVFAIKKDLNKDDVSRFIQRTASVRGAPIEGLAAYQKIMSDFVSQPTPGFDINVWAAKQVYIALGFFMSAAAALGVDACPMEGLDPAAYDKILGLDKKGYATRVVATAGYRSADDKYATAPKVRFDRADVIEIL